MRDRKRLISTGLKVLISAGLLGLLLAFRTSPAEIWREIRHADPFWLALSFSLHALGLLISAVRWRILIAAQGHRAPLGYLIRSYLVGTFFNTLLPSRIGGDVVRIWDGKHLSRSLVKSSAVVFVERLSGIIVLLVFAAGAALLRLDMARRIPVIWISLILGLAGLGGVFLLLHPFPARWLERISGPAFLRGAASRVGDLQRAVRGFRDQGAALARVFFWALLLQINVVIHFILIGKALHLRIAPLDYFIFIPIVLLIQLIPVTINGLGLREGAYTEIFAFYGISPGAAVSFSLIDVAFMLAVGLVGGVLYILRRGSPARTEPEIPPDNPN
jgi:uncharacterized membrane protein YbhN (UPF0104 family)